MLKTLATLALVFNGHPGSHVELAANFTAWGERPIPLTETTPGHYSVDLPEPWLPEIQYKFLIDGQWQDGPNTVLPTSFKEDPLLSPRPGVRPMGEQYVAVRDWEGTMRTATVLTPPFPHHPGARAVTIYFQDGGDYLERTGVRNLLANLSATGRLPELTAVFLPPKDREREYGLTESSEGYAYFFAKTLVPAVEARFPTGGTPADRLVIGPSLGGLITAYIGLRHPDVFGNVASQSGSFWFSDEAVLNLLPDAVKTGQRLYFEVGTYESPQMPEYNRKAVDVARRAGVDMTYEEHPSIHDWISWRSTLGRIFVHFFGNKK